LPSVGAGTSAETRSNDTLSDTESNLQALAIGTGQVVNLKNVHVRNRCKHKVYMGPQGGPAELALVHGSSQDLTSQQVKDMLKGRVTSSLTNDFGQSSNNEVFSWVELGTGFPQGYDAPNPRNNFNFIGQEGWNGLNIRVSMNKPGGGLACADGLAYTSFGNPETDCNFDDGSGIRTDHVTPDGFAFQACKSKFIGKMESCTAWQALYLVEHSRDSSGSASARSCGNNDYPNQFTAAKYADGAVCLTSFQNHGRQNGGRSVTCECFESPCAYGYSEWQTCTQSERYVPVGSQGFFTCVDRPSEAIAVDMLIEFSCDAL